MNFKLCFRGLVICPKFPLNWNGVPLSFVDDTHSSKQYGDKGVLVQEVTAGLEILLSATRQASNQATNVLTPAPNDLRSKL
jgi:hypothetical protein